MPKKNVPVEEGLQTLLPDLLAKRQFLVEVLDSCSKDPELCSLLPTLRSVSAKLDRIATQLQWVIEAGLTKASAGDPRLIDQIQAAQRHLLGVASNAISAAIEELLAGEWDQGEPAN